MAKRVKNKTTPGYTDTELEQWAAEAEEGYRFETATPIDPKTMNPVELRGRPSLSGSGTSRKLQVRIDPALNSALRKQAKIEDRSVSDLVRQILREGVRADR